MGGDGVQGARFNSLFLGFIIVCLIVYLLVIGGLTLAIIRGAARSRRGEAGNEAAIRPVFVVWVVLIGVTLIGLTFASYFTDRALARDGTSGPTLTIELTANQWWWDVNYEGANPSEELRTANELHLPAGRLVRIKLRSNDVIHSFWVPNLAGKQDLIPGRDIDIALLPTRSGRYRGQCAEFCGMQHAHMALDVTVESPSAFEAWRRHQLTPAAPPPPGLATEGYAYVTGRECSMCHNITGTNASASVGPDLTHFASRRSIGAGTFPMTTGHLYAWVADPQGAKPGNHMPVIGLEPRELDAVVAYLRALR
jgi:cytochrome c oxidase subunit 2